jgi:hypothetical protein
VWPYPVLAALCLVLFADVLLFRTDVVLSEAHADLYDQFLHWLSFGFSELRRGNLPLWNPHVFSGTPFLGASQSALLYPLNLVYLLLPLAQAVNWSIASHVFLAGALMCLWCRHRGASALASLFGGVLAMFCGAHFLRVFAGHLSIVCTLPWTILILFALDGAGAALRTTAPLKDRLIPVAGWVCAGAAGVALQVLAGHPQSVYYTAIAAGLYALLRSGPLGTRAAALATFAAFYALGMLISGYQLAASWEAAAESVRQGGLDRDFAGMFSFPPENLVALIAPAFFGNTSQIPYWGRCYFFEMTPFLGLSGLGLAIYGATDRARPERATCLAMVLALFVLALGRHTPLYPFLHGFVPGFDLFRGTAKFFSPLSLFAILLAVMGVDRLRRGTGISPAAAIALTSTALVLVAGALFVRHQATVAPAGSVWQAFLAAISATGESDLPAPLFADAAFVRRTALGASRALLVAALSSVLFGGALFARRFAPQAPAALVALGTLEMLFFAASFRPVFPLEDARLPELRRVIPADLEAERTLNPSEPNVAMSYGTHEIWGYDAGVSRRYAEFMTFTQGLDPDAATQYLSFTRLHPWYALLRCGVVLVREGGGFKALRTAGALPRLLLIDEFSIAADRDDAFLQMSRPDFDPRRTVVLENQPWPAPLPAGDRAGDVRVLEESTDHLTIVADVSRPVLLLITDSYSRGWRASALPGSEQRDYEVLPADYVLRAIPLGPGRHALRLEYAPAALAFGAWASITGVLLLAGLAWTALRPLPRSGPSGQPPAGSAPPPSPASD